MNDSEYWYKPPSWWARLTFPIRTQWWSLLQRWRGRPSREDVLFGVKGRAVEEQRVREYSAAVTPAPWTDDISKHNLKVHAGYQAEIQRRKTEMLAGTYKPRYLTADGEQQYVAHGYSILGVHDVDWDMEMTMRPGARVEVTGTAPRFKRLDAEQIAAIKEEQMARNAVDPNAVHHATARGYIGSREDVLKAVQGNEQLADLVEQQARDFFGVTDLDAPLRRKVAR